MAESTQTFRQFLFNDTDLKTPKHDAIMLWLDENMDDILAELSPDKTWSDEVIQRAHADIRKRLEKANVERDIPLDFDTVIANAGPPPPPILKAGRKVWEYPVINKHYQGKSVIGFIDLFVDADRPGYLEMEHKQWKIGYSGGGPSFAFEVKTSIPSLGELIRQVRLYQEYVNRARFFVVASDARFAAQLHAQGIGFIKYEG